MHCSAGNLIKYVAQIAIVCRFDSHKRPRSSHPHNRLDTNPAVAVVTFCQDHGYLPSFTA